MTTYTEADIHNLTGPDLDVAIAVSILLLLVVLSR